MPPLLPSLSLLSIGTVIATIPLVFPPGDGRIKNQFVAITCLSFAAVPLIVVASLLLPGRAGTTFMEFALTFHTMGWAMLLTALVAAVTDRQLFFYNLVSVPLSLVLSAFVAGGFILELGTAVALVVAAEAVIYLGVNGARLTRVVGLTALTAVLLATIHVYPAAYLGRFDTALLITAYLALAAALYILHVAPAGRIRLRHVHGRALLGYLLVTAVLAAVSALFVGLLEQAFVLGAFFAILILLGVYHSPEVLTPLADFLEFAYVVTAVGWAATTLFTLSAGRGALTVRFVDITLLEIAVLAAVNLVGVRIIQNALHRQLYEQD